MDVSALTDLPLPTTTDYMLSWRGSAPYRLSIYNVLVKDTATDTFLLSKFGGQINLDSNFASVGGGAAYYSGAWRNTVANQGGWAITNQNGVLAIQTGSNPGAAGSVITDMTEKFRIDATGKIYINSPGSGSSKFNLFAGNLGIAAGDEIGAHSIFCLNNNMSQINYVFKRNSSGSDWTTSSMRIQAVVDSTRQGYIEFNPPGGLHALAFGSGSSAVEGARLSEAGNFGINTTNPNAKLHVISGDKTGGISGPSSNTWAAKIIANQDSNGMAGLSIQTRWAGAGTPIFEVAQGWNSSGGVGYHPVFTVDGDGAVRPGADNAFSLGTSSFRWATLYVATGAIYTSDEREKAWRGKLTDAEVYAAKLIAAELGFYQWLQSIDEKDENTARYHFGVRAQRVFGILKDCGLDWRSYAWCCYDKWDDLYVPIYEEVEVEVEVEGVVTKVKNYLNLGKTKQTQVAGDRYGVRTDQLALFLIAAQEQRLLQLEEALS